MQENSQIFDKKIGFLIMTRIFDYFRLRGYRVEASTFVEGLVELHSV